MGRASPELLDPTRYAYTYEMQTRFADVDSNQHINNVAMAAAFEDSRVRFDKACGIRAEFAGMRVMIVAAAIDYIGEAHYPAPLVLHCGVLHVGRTSWTTGQLAVQEGTPRAYCRATMCATEGGKPAPLPDRLRGALLASRIHLSGEE
jgi:acyl-CoA thioester hydrolase